MAKNICVVILLAAIIVCPGCVEYEYTIEMMPQGDAMKRTISFSSNLSEQDKQSVTKFYPEQIDVNTFSGAFKVELPNDVGGAGFYTHVVTAMGSASTYTERFRGNDDINRHIEDFQTFVDKYVNFTINWLEFELGKDPNFGNLREFLDKDLRADAKNFGLYFWLGSVIEPYDSNAVEEMKLRTIHYLEERGYIAPGQADILMKRSDRNGEEELCKLARDIVAREIGYCQNDDGSGKLAFLDSAESIEKSVIRYIHSTQRFKQMWDEEKKSQDDANLAPPDIDIHKFIAEDFPFEFDWGLMPYKVNVRLKCSQKPFETNGQWDEPNEMVHWSSYLQGKDNLPTFYYAEWSEPNSDFQSCHFGRVILDGKNLAEYCYWEKSIEEGQAQQWEEFISGIDPNMEISETVRAFRFSGESADPNAATLAQFPRMLIINALSGQQ
jgi:hypothetical protein